MRKTVLIVDDNADIRKAMRRQLEGQDGFFSCAEAVDGRDAIEKANEFRPDLIVLDFSMPEMNGIEAARVLSGVMPEVPLILFSMHAGPLLECDARAAGISALVTKGEGLDTLLHHIQKLLKIAPNPQAGQQDKRDDPV